jgi:hypothetical protein
MNQDQEAQTEVSLLTTMHAWLDTVGHDSETAVTAY